MLKHIFYMAGLYLLSISPACAQEIEEDLVSVEAYVSFHKKVSTVLLTRSALEELASITHDHTQSSACDYKDVNVQLDKYDKCFDVLDALLRTSATVGNAYLTYDDVTNRLREYKALLNDYKEKCLKRGNIVSTDTVIVSISAKTIEDVVYLSNELIKSIATSQLYLSGVLHCTTRDYIFVVDTVNGYLDDVRRVVNGAYMFLWQYIFNRTHYWKNELVGAKDLHTMAEDALQRWYDNAHQGSQLSQ